MLQSQVRIEGVLRGTEWFISFGVSFGVSFEARELRTIGLWELGIYLKNPSERPSEGLLKDILNVMLLL